MDPEQVRLLEAAIRERGSVKVLQMVMRIHPDRRADILRLVAELGPDDALRRILQLPAPEPEPELPAVEQPEPMGAAPQMEKMPAGQVAEALPQAVSAMRTAERTVNEVGLGAAGPQQFQTAPDYREIQELSGPAGITVQTPMRTERQADRLAPGMEPELPTQPIPTGRSPEAQEAMMPPGETPLMDQAPAEMSDIYDMLLDIPTPGEVVTPRVDILSQLGQEVSLKEKWKSMGTNAIAFSTLCSKNGVPVELALAIIKQESKFNPTAKSSVGALGLMQLMPGTARDQGLRVTTKIDERGLPKKNLSAGLGYLSWLKRNYKPTTVDKWLAAYNAGPGRLRNDQWKKIPETNNYINKIKKTIQLYQKDPGLFGKDLSSLLQHLK